VTPTNWIDMEGYIQHPTLAAWFRVPQTMTLQEWTDVFIECILNPTAAPVSFAPIALRMLGFGPRTKQITDAIPDFESQFNISAALLEDRFVPVPDPDRQARAFVIRLAAGFPSWPVSRLFAAFVSTAERLEALLKSAPFTQQHFGVSRIFVEVDAKQAATAIAQPLTAANLFAHFPKVQDFVGRSAVTIIGAEFATRVPTEQGSVRSRASQVSWMPYTKDLDAAMEMAEKAGVPMRDELS
jgi:hypothetical protein